MVSKIKRLLFSNKKKRKKIINKLKINKLKIYNYFFKEENTQNDIYNFITSLKCADISIDNIPKNLENKIIIKKLPIKNFDKTNVINKIMKDLKNTMFRSNNITITDYLDYGYTKYYFLPHTDIEWGQFKNKGYQVWYLKNNLNENNYGNMFILHNEYLNKKYENKPYKLYLYDDKIYVIKNTNNFISDKVKNYILKKKPKRRYKKKHILEILNKDWFIKNTIIYYLDIKDHEYIAFDKNTTHMSDIRDTKRYAINFRVLNGKAIRKKNVNKFVSKIDLYIK